MKTAGRPQEIIAKAVRNSETVDFTLLGWLWEDFQALRVENARLRERVGALEAAGRAAVEWLPKHEPTHPGYEGERSDAGRTLRQVIDDRAQEEKE